MKKYYIGIGIYHPKTTENIGTLWRSAHNFGADFIFTIGARYKRQASDTTAAQRHVPLYHYKDWDDFLTHMPVGSELVCVEQTNGESILTEFRHPKSAVYVLGAEDEGIPTELMRRYQKVEIITPHCLNVAASLVLYDRQAKEAAPKDDLSWPPYGQKTPRSQPRSRSPRESSTRYFVRHGLLASRMSVARMNEPPSSRDGGLLL